MSTKDLSGFSNDPSAEESHAGNYFRGFYDAEKRRKIINHDPTVGQAIAGAALGAIPFALIAYFIMRRRTAKAVAAASGAPAQSGFMQQMQSTMEKMMNPAGNRDFRVEVKDTTFKDVLGIPEALEEVQQYVRFLRTPEEFTRLGGRLPRGCLLSGDPGTGKTLLARAVAGEAGVPFFSCSGADFIEVYAGSGPKRVRELFAAAKKECPSVIFIDEIDAVGSRSSGSDNSGLHGEENRTINQLLAELDGLNAGDPVIVFAATNFRDNLDRALLREGRFDRKVEIPMPDRAARAELFTHYLGKVVSEDPATQATALAELTPGVSPATIAAVVNEAALSAAIQDKPAVSLKDLLPAIDDVLIGKKHRNRMSVQAAQRTALHEAGHTLIASLLPEQSAVIKASITPRGPAAGFTQQVGRETLDMPTEFSLFTDICVMLGGRLAELTQHDNLTTGAQDDYQRATKTALRSFLSFGLSSQVGLLSVEPQRLDEGRMHQRHSEEAQKVAEAEAALLVGAATQLVRQLLTQHQATLKRIADELFDKKELLREDLQRIMDLERLSKDSISAEVRSALTRYTAKSEELALQRTARRESMTMATN